MSSDVVATAGNKEKIVKCLQLGADPVVNHRESDWYRKVCIITNKQGMDAVYEHIDKTNFPQELSLLKMRGLLDLQTLPPDMIRQLTCGICFLKEPFYWVERSNPKPTRRSNTMCKGKIKPVIDTILLFGNMVEGHVKMVDSQVFGKVLTTPQKL
jgi:alcohol dehydrogenase